MSEGTHVLHVHFANCSIGMLSIIVDIRAMSEDTLLEALRRGGPFKITDAETHAAFIINPPHVASVILRLCDELQEKDNGAEH